MADASLGGCACGAVRFSAQVTGTTMDACHCGTCRRLNAGPLMVVEVEELTFADAAAVAVHDSSEWAERPFCPRCGTSLGYRLKDGRYTAVNAFAFDVPLDLRLAVEVHIEEKPASYAFAGDTKKMTGAEVVAAFGG